MKLDFDEDRRRQMIRAYGPGYVQVADRRITGPCLVTPDELVFDLLPASFAELDGGHLHQLLARRPDVLLFGTGARQRFPGDALLRALAEARVGYEFMDTHAACRSYNVLVAEHRRVLAALFIGD